MNNLVNEILNQFDDKAVSEIGQKAGVSSTEVQSALGSIVPMILGSVNQKATSNSNPFDLGSLIGMLDGDKDGSVLDNIAGFVTGGSSSKFDILGQLFGGKQNLLASALGQKSGMNSSTMASILQFAAPVILSYLGRKKKNEGETNLLEQMMGFQNEVKTKAPESDSFLERLIDQDGDGDSSDDLLRMGTSILGKLF